MKSGIWSYCILLTAICLGNMWLLWGCKRNAEMEVRITEFSFFLLSEDIDYPSAMKMGIEDLPCRSQPWISLADIEMYDVSGGCLHLNREVAKPSERISMRGRPFVITVDGRRLRVGTFWSGLSSLIAPAETSIIHLDTYSRDCDDLLSIKLLGSQLNEGGVSQQPDLIRNVLEREGKLHEGIGCQVDNVEIIPAGDSSTVRYTYTITNKDTDNLYVLDPERMDSDDFRAMWNGVVVIRGVDAPTRIYRPDRTKYVRSVPYGTVDPEWFTMIESKKSRRWTVELKGAYPKIAPGRYSCSFGFGSPYYGHGATGVITKDLRIREDGRLWIGQLRVNRKLIEVE